MGDVKPYRTTEQIVAEVFDRNGTFPGQRSVVVLDRAEFKRIIWETKLNEKNWMLEHYHRAEGKDD